MYFPLFSCFLYSNIKLGNSINCGQIWNWKKKTKCQDLKIEIWMSISQPKCALKCKLGIEYGAFFGADVAQCLLDFSQIISLEGSVLTLYERLKRPFLNYKRIPLYPRHFTKENILSKNKGSSIFKPITFFALWLWYTKVFV